MVCPARRRVSQEILLCRESRQAFLLGRIRHVYRTHKPTAEKGLTETSVRRYTVLLAEEKNPHHLELWGEGPEPREEGPVAFLPRGLETRATLQVETFAPNEHRSGSTWADGAVIHSPSDSAGAGWKPFIEEDTVPTCTPYRGSCWRGIRV